MSRILVSGSMAYDRIMNFPGLFKDHFLPDKLHNLNISFQVESLAEHFGGTAGNIAYNLSLLGEEPTILSNIGTDSQKYFAHLEERGISRESIVVIPTTFSSGAYIMTDKSDNQIAAFYMGAGSYPYAKELVINANDIVLVGAGNVTDMEKIPTLAKEANATLLFDPGQGIPALSAEALKSGIEKAAALFVNDYELAMIMKKTGWGEADIASHVSTLIITLGKDGSRVITKEGETRAAAVPAKEVKDPTGAGDAFRAGYIKGLRLGKSPVDCAKLGAAVAVFAVESIGTQEHHPTLDDIKKRYEAAYGETSGL